MMKKYLLSLFAVALMALPGVMKAQSCDFTITSTQSFIEGFEGVSGTTFSAAGVLPSCWNGFSNGTNTVYMPHVTGSGSYWYPKTGSNCLSLTSGAAAYGSNKHVMLPAVTNPLSDLVLTFWMKTESSTNGVLSVGYYTSATDTSSFVAVQSVPVSSATANSNGGCGVEVALSSVPATAVRLGFRWYVNSTSYYTCCIDDVSLDLAPDCAAVTNVAMGTVSSSEASFSWHENGTASSWTVYYDTVMPLSSSALMVSVNDTACTLTDLESNTEYYCLIQPDCSGVAGNRNFSFRTPCVPVASDDLPYAYGFEDATASGTTGLMSPCWDRVRVGSTSNYPYPSTTNKHTGTYGAYIYNTSSIKSWFALPEFEDDLSSLQLSFWAYKTSANYGHLMVGVMSDINDLTTFDTLATIDVQALSTWEYFEVPLAGYTGNGTRIVIAGLASATNYTYIDDVTVDYLPSCVAPTGATATNITQSSVDLEWNENGSASSWLVEYGPAGFLQGEGTEVEAFSNPFTLDDLNAGTSYTAYIRSVCSDTSSATAVQFATQCGYITLPFVEGFESYATGSSAQFPYCWTRINDATGTINYYPYVNTSTTNAHGGTKYMYFYASTTDTYANNEYMVLPAIDTTETPMNTIEVSFWARYGTGASTLQIGVMSDPTADSTFVPVQTVNVNSTTYQQFTIPFTTFAGYGNHIAVKQARQAASAYVYFDDLMVYEHNNCASPLDVTVEGVTAEGFTISWTDTANVGSYMVYYGRPGFDIDTVYGESCTDTTFTVEDGLMSDSYYEVVVKANCGNTLSNPSYPVVLHTSCVEVPADSLPYVENFDRYSSGASATINSCWTKGTSYTTQYPYPYGTTPINGANSLYFYSNSTAYSYAAMPMFETDINELCVRFNIKNYSTISSTYGSVLLVGVMSNPDDISTFELVREIDYTAEGANAVTACEVYLDQYQGNGRFIAFMSPTTTPYPFSTNYVKLDDVVVDSLPDCRVSTDLVVSNVTADGADITWRNGSSNAGSFTVAYSTQANFDPATAASVTVYDTMCSLTNLSNYTQYYARVKANCDANASWSDKVEFHTLLDCGDNRVNVIGTVGDGTSSGYTYMMYNYTSYPSGYSAAAYTAAEMANLGLYGNNEIHSIAVQCGATGGTNSNIKIYMKECNFDGFTNTTIGGDTAALFAGMTKVYDGPLTAVPQQWTDITLDSVFTYQGSGNLLIRFVRFSAPSASSTFYYTSTSPSYLSCYGYRSSATTANFTATRAQYRPNVRFNVCTEIPTCERPMGVNLVTYTDHDATIAWNGNATDTYQYLISTNSQLDSNATPITVVGDTAHVTGLNANYGYYFWVRKACASGEFSDWSMTLHFVTPCGAVSLPYFEDFESYGNSSTSAIDPCWTRHAVGTTTQYPYPSSTAAINSTRGLYFYSYRPSSATTAAYYDWATLPMFDAAVDSLELRFDMKRYNSSSATYTTEIYVGVMSNPDDIETFDTIAYLDMRQDPAGTVRSYEVDFSQYHGQGRFLAFYLPPQPFTGTASYSYAYIDNVEVTRISNCRRPADVQVSAVTTNSATVAWTDRTTNPQGFEVSVAPFGDPANSGIIVPALASPLQVTGLAPSTYYAAYVRVICAPGDTSDWSAADFFHTECAPVTSLPLTFTFEGDATGTSSPLPYCWNRYNDGTTNGYYPYINNTTSYAHSGSNVLYFYSSTTATTYGDTMMAVLPEIDASIPTSNIEVSFWGRTMNTSYANSEVKVGILSDPTDPSTFVPSGSFHFTPEHQFYTIDLAGNTSNGHYIAFMMTRQTTAQYAYIDDITIDRGSACPRAYALTGLSATQNSATIGWSDTASAMGYVVTYWPVSNPSQVSTVTSTTTSTILTGLASSTEYNFNVRALCLSGDTAMGARELGRFATTQVPANVPYTYNFEDAAEWANWQTNSNQSTNWYRGTAVAGQGQYSMYVSSDNGATRSTNMAQVVNAVAYRDIDFGATPSSYTLTFKASVGGTTDANYDGLSIILTNPATVVEASDANITSPWGHVNDVAIRTVRRDSNWVTYQAHFDNIAGVQRVAFYWFNQATGATHPFDFGPAAVDEISIAEMECIRPYDVYADNLGVNNATLHWTGEANATYTVIYREYPGTPDMNQSVTATTNSLVLNNLDANTEYIFWVKKNCSSTSVSPECSGVRFATVCNVYVAADTIRENFSGIATGTVAYNNAGSLPECWVGLTNGTDNTYTPHVVNSGSYWYAHDSNAVVMTSSSTATYGNTKILRMPYTAEPINSLTLSFWMCTESSSYGTLYVGYMTGETIDDFVAIESIPASTATLHSGSGNQAANVGVWDTVSFESAPANAQYVAFKWFHDATFYSICLDDIELTSSNTCAAPVVTVSNVDYESADLSWAGSGMSYEVAIVAHGEDWPAATSIAAPSYHVTGLLPNTEYDYRVRQLCDSTNASIWIEGNFTTTDLPCSAPASLVASNVTVNSASIAWTVPAQSNAQAWVVNVFNTTTNIMDTVTSNPVTINGLYDNTQYFVTVQSICSALISSEWSDTISFTTTACQGVSNVQVSNITATGATVTWTPGAGQTAWEVSYGNRDFVEGQGTVVPVTSTTYQITGLEAETRYDVYVRSVCAEGITSDWSPVSQFETPEEGGVDGIDGVDGNYSLTIYPNPTAGNTTISLRGIEGDVVISIVDMNGRTIQSDRLSCGSDCAKTLDVEGLAQGTYFVRVLGDGINSVRKLIVR